MYNILTKQTTENLGGGVGHEYFLDTNHANFLPLSASPTHIPPFTLVYPVLFS